MTACERPLTPSFCIAFVICYEHITMGAKFQEEYEFQPLHLCLH